MVLGPILSLFAKSASKLFINDSVCNVFRTTFSDVADCCFPIGKVTFADVAKAHHVLLGNIMVLASVLTLFAERASKVFINDSVYKGF